MTVDRTSQTEILDPTATTFKGIPHYETWTVLKWIKEDRLSFNYWQNEARKVYRQTQKEGDPVVKLAELLERRHMDYIPPRVGVYRDLIEATLTRVNWRDVAVELLALV